MVVTVFPTRSTRKKEEITLMIKFNEFVNERESQLQPIFTWERADMWFERIKKEPEIQKYIGVQIMNNEDYNKFKKVIKNILYKYKNDLYPKEMEYVRERLYDVVFEVEGEE